MKHFLLLTILAFCFFNTSAQKTKITTPNGGEIWEAGTTETITWIEEDTIIVPEVAIWYSIDSGSTWTLIEGMYPNTESYSWLVPNTPSEKCLVRVIGDTSDAVFSIVNPCGIAAFTLDDTICSGASVEISAGVILTCPIMLTFNWQPGNLSGQTETVSPTATTTYTVTATDGNFTYVDSVTVNVKICPGIEENAGIENLKVTFNSNEKLFTVKFSSETSAEIMLFNLAGQRINIESLREKHMGGSFEKTFSTTELPAGLYFVRIQTIKGSASTKISVY